MGGSDAHIVSHIGRCATRFSRRGCINGLYDRDVPDDGREGPPLRREIEDRYRDLIDLIGRAPDLIQGGGNLSLPADPTYTACRLTPDGVRLVATIIDSFPPKPDFRDWPDRRTYPEPGSR